MKKRHILIVAFSYPPLFAIGSRRIAMLARGLYDKGFIPHIITAKNPPQKYPLENLVPEQYVHHVRWFDIWQLIYLLNKFKLTKIFGKVLGYYIPFASNTVPERRRFYWIRPAIKKGLQIIDKYDIELIYSSYTPPASIRIASALKDKTGLPWINEYRDLWTGNPYVKQSEKERKMNFQKEKEMIAKTNALVTVSEPLKKELEKLHQKPTYVIYNGIDEIKEFNIQSFNESKIIIVYAGSIYKGKRDPMPFFQALKILKEKDTELYFKFSINFYGPGLTRILGKDIDDLELNDIVKLHEPVSHAEILDIQEKADILLLLGWNNKADVGVLTGKVFEYLGMKKPILGLGYKEGAMDNVLKETNTGKIINNPQEIYKYLIKITKIVQNKKRLKSFKDNITIESYYRKRQINNLVEIIKKHLVVNSSKF